LLGLQSYGTSQLSEKTLIESNSKSQTDSEVASSIRLFLFDFDQGLFAFARIRYAALRKEITMIPNISPFEMAGKKKSKKRHK